MLHSVVHGPCVVLAQTLDDSAVSTPDRCPFFLADKTLQSRLLANGPSERVFDRRLRQRAAALLCFGEALEEGFSKNTVTLREGAF